MDISTALSVDLKNLLRVLDLPDMDVERSLRALRFDVAVAVPSFVGLALTLVVEGQAVTLTSVEDDREFPPIGSSLRLPVELTATIASGSELILYAGTPGAFVDLAADLSYALSRSSADEIQLDQHLRPISNRSGLSGVEELSMINRALGILMGAGRTPEEARVQLERQAASSGLEVAQVAAYLVSLRE
ncbi:MAG: hypothetical protein ABWX96_17150 [Propionibacteriaceae bacterium]